MNGQFQRAFTITTTKYQREQTVHNLNERAGYYKSLHNKNTGRNKCGKIFYKLFVNTI
jgi:hypothetical protein